VPQAPYICCPIIHGSNLINHLKCSLSQRTPRKTNTKNTKICMLCVLCIRLCALCDKLHFLLPVIAALQLSKSLFLSYGKKKKEEEKHRGTWHRKRADEVKNDG
jgi:hypothetical protein